MTSSVPPSQHEMAPLSRENRPTIVGPDIPDPSGPYPLKLQGVVTSGFGRGARFLGIPTANLPDSSLSPLNDLSLTGIYYGFARIHPSTSTPAPSRTPSSTNLQGLTSEGISSIQPTTAPYPPDSKPITKDGAVPGEVPEKEVIEGGGRGKRLSVEDGKVWPMVMSVGWNPYFKNEKITAEVHIIHPFTHDFYGHDMSVLVLGYIRPELDYVSKEALIKDINTDVQVALNSLARPGYAGYSSDPFFRRI